MSESREKPEVLGCDASIVKNVWEIRLKETEAKNKKEEMRVQKSALSSINDDWSQRLAIRTGQKYVPKKKLERSATVDVPIDSSNAFASKKPLQPPPGFNSGSRGGGRGGLGKGGLVRSNTLPSPSMSKDKKKIPNKNLVKLQLLTSIDQTQPSTMVWSKSWKYNKPLPKPGEGEEVASTWGQCWRLAVQQPYSEAVKPWPNGPNLVDHRNLSLCENYVHRMIESRELDLDLPTDEWQMSWKNSERQKGQAGKSSSSQKGSDDPKYWMFSSLEETQHQNEALCSSEWSESWKSTKPQEEGQHAPSTEPTNGPIESPVQTKPKNGMPTSCWKFMNHQLHYKSKQSSSVQNCNHAEWDKSWRAAVTVTNGLKKAAQASSPMQHQKDVHGVHDNEEEPLHKVIISVSRESKYRDFLKSLCCDEHKPLSEWERSWQMTKNNSKPSEELEKALKSTPAKTQVEKVEKPKGQRSLTERTDPRYEQLRNEVIYTPRMQFTQSRLLRLRHLENASSGTEWRESWQTLKHYMRLERRRTRPQPSRPFREASKGGERKPDMSEWKESWKYTNKPLNQEAELWQQDWPTIPRVRPNRAGEHNHFIEPMVMPKNGPTAAHIWDESWRMPRPQHQPEVHHHHHHQPGQLEHRGRQRSVADWQESWMVSDSQFHHDRPSLTQWMDAWRQSGFHMAHSDEQLLQHSGTSMVIVHWRGKLPLQKAKAKMSQSFDSHIFRERYPEKQWNGSWKATCLLSCSSGMTEHGQNNNMHEQSFAPVSEQSSEWGMSFRIANPMPHVDRSWVECSPNPSHHMVMFTRGTQSRRQHLFASINKDHSQHKYFAQYFKIWGKSYRFLMGPSSSQATDKSSPSMSKQQVHDPWVLMVKNINMKKYLYVHINKENPDGKKWAGCHLLCKTQPRPKRSSAPVKKPAAEEADTTADNKFFEEWSESWRFVVRPQTLKKQAPVKNLSGWGDSWKFLLPPYPTQNGPMRKAM